MNAKNSITSSRSLFIKRRSYDLFAYSEIKPKNIRNTILGDHQLYGRVTKHRESMFLKANTLNFLPSSNPSRATVTAVNFVVQAFQGLMIELSKMFNQKKLMSGDTIFNNFDVTRAYQDPVVMYRQHVSHYFSAFNDYMADGTRSNKVKNIYDYIHELRTFHSDRAYGLPIIFSTWLQSKYCDPFVSGLMLEFGDFNLDVDDLKLKNYINHPSFQAYANLAIRHGFFIPKHYPNILVADLGSPAMKRLIVANFPHTVGRISDSDSIIRTCYSEAYQYDVDLLLEEVVDNYNRYIVKSPYYVEKKICKISGKLLIKKLEKPMKTPVDFLKEFTISKSVQLYLYLRHNEEGRVLPPKKFTSVNKNAVNLQKKVDTYSAVSYINNELSSSYRTRKGSSINVKVRNSIQAANQLKRIDEGHKPSISPDDLERMKRSYTEYNNYSNISVSIPSLPRSKTKSYENYDE